MDQLKWKKVILGAAAAGLMSLATWVVADSVSDRLAPVGKVCMAGDDCAGGATVVAAGEARSPEEIFNTKCNACHGTGVGGAPKPGDEAAWEPRLEKGMDAVFENAWNGFNAMPAKGICMDCSEEEFRSTIEYMIK